MSARVLIVDDLPPNVKLLEARLSAEYYEVLTATSGKDALRICGQGLCDIVLLDVMMPEMDGFEVCRRLKADANTAHIPVVMVTALDQPSDRVRGLDAGADDFLTKPIDEVALLARVRSLVRLKVIQDELRSRALSSIALGVPCVLNQDNGDNGTILLVEDREAIAERMVKALGTKHKVELLDDAAMALARVAEGGVDTVIVSLGLADYDGLRLCSQLRSNEATRHLPIVMIADMDERERILRGLDLGANDYLTRPIDRNELIARVKTQVRRKRYADYLRDNVQASIEAAVIDPLTGLHNRRYFESRLATLLVQANSTMRPLSMMILDIDHFKKVNDGFGHDVGDEVLKIFAARMKSVTRDVDLVCRLGGEEFVVVMPDTSIAIAKVIAERVRLSVEEDAFTIRRGAGAIPVTVSVGIAEAKLSEPPEEIFRRVDQALYSSKQAGRNRVTAAAA